MITHLTFETLFGINPHVWAQRVVELNGVTIKLRPPNAKRAKQEEMPEDQFKKIEKLLTPGRGYVTPKGYVILRIRGRAIAQHRAVMEVKLGRPLKKSEHVHHINGDRSNNSPQNLELWTTNHPYGIRMSDCPKTNHKVEIK